MNKEQEKIVHELWINAINSKYECKDYPNMICKKKHVIKILELLLSYEKALNKACDKLETLDSLISTNGSFEYRESEEWKAWCLEDE